MFDLMVRLDSENATSLTKRFSIAHTNHFTKDFLALSSIMPLCPATVIFILQTFSALHTLLIDDKSPRLLGDLEHFRMLKCSQSTPFREESFGNLSKSTVFFRKTGVYCTGLILRSAYFVITSRSTDLNVLTWIADSGSNHIFQYN